MCSYTGEVTKLLDEHTPSMKNILTQIDALRHDCHRQRGALHEVQDALTARCALVQAHTSPLVAGEHLSLSIGDS